MTWARFDDGCIGHRKLLPLTDAAFRLWFSAVCYCNQQSNDGQLDRAALKLLFGYLEDPGKGSAALAELVRAGLLDATENGYELHDYLEYQRSREEVAESNRAAAERMRNIRAARAAKRAVCSSEHAANFGPNFGGTSGEVRSSQPNPTQPIPDLKKTPTVQPPSFQPDPTPQADAIASAGFALTPESQPNGPQDANAPKPTRKPDPIPNIALGLFAELQQARRRCNPNVPTTESKTKCATREIERCLREGITVEQLRHVIAVWEALVKSGKRLFEHFNSVTPFRASNVYQYVEMPLDTAKAGRTDPRKSDADLAREADNRAYFESLRAGLKRGDVIDVPSVPNQLDERGEQ